MIPGGQGLAHGLLHTGAHIGAGATHTGSFFLHSDVHPV
jgi:hypothetical protein